MTVHGFMFSTQRTKRLQRHLLFWLAGYLFFVLTYPPNGYGNVGGFAGDKFFRFYEMASIRNLFCFSFQMIFCYGLAYFLLPFFFWKKKYLQFVCAGLLLWVVVALFAYSSLTYVYNPVIKRLRLAPDPKETIVLISIKVLFFTSLSSQVFIFISLKLFKDWQQKQNDILTLKKENANAELSLLKAQVHPHFLFNTLNNIYSFTLNKSEQAMHLVKKLEGMLYYITEECNKPSVDLHKELRLITDYIELEKVRYGNRLTIHTEFKGDFNNKSMAPLLMLPFVENSFKHGAGKMLESSWIKLEIEVKESSLHFSLLNSKPGSEISGNGKRGIGLNNVKKRLALLYTGNYYLQFESTSDTFKVDMQLPVEENAVAKKSAEKERLSAII